jgi:hypothetical protein
MEQMNESLPLTVEYTLEREELTQAVKLDDRRRGTVRVRWILTVLVAAAVIVSIFQIIRDPSRVEGYCLFTAGVLLGWVLWYLPHRSNRRYIDRVLNEGWKHFTTTITEEEIRLSDPSQPDNEKHRRSMQYDGRLLICEAGPLFLLIYEKTRLYPLPKRVLTLEDTVALHELFHNKGRDNFIELDPKTGKRLYHK